MTPRSPLRLYFFGLLFLLSWTSSRAHDLMATYILARLHPERLELQIKIAADSAWPRVQDLSPGAIFTPEDFETVGKPLLLAFAKTMDEVTVDGKIVAPVKTDVVVADDTFLFAFSYPLPPRGAVRLKENYLAKMSPDYATHVRLFDPAGAQVEARSLTAADPTFSFVLPLSKSSGSTPPAKPGDATGPATKP